MLREPATAPGTTEQDPATTDAAVRVEAWWRENADRVRAYLHHRVDPSTADDLLQEVFVLAIRRSDVVPEPPTGWLFGTARRVLANHLRAGRRYRGMLDRLVASHVVAPTSDQPAGTGERAAHAELHALLAGLSAPDREVLTLTAWYGLTAAEAAEALGITANAYGVRLHRARARLVRARATDVVDAPSGGRP